MTPASELIDGYLDGSLTPDQVAELEQWLRDDPEHRRHFLRRAAFQQYIEEDARSLGFQATDDQDLSIDPIERFDRLLAALESHSGEARLRHLDPDARATRPSRDRSDAYPIAAYIKPRAANPDHPTHESLALLGVQFGRGVGGLKVRDMIAAVLLIGACVGLYLWLGGDEPRPDVVAEDTATPPEATGPVVWGRVTSLSGDAIDAEGIAVATGETLMTGRWRLKTGFMQARTRQGARVLVQAPCSFDLNPDGSMTLTRGRLTAFVPEPATGFTVNTSAMRVMDLGTEFGVDVLDDGTTTAAVFDGIVELQATPAEHRDRPETVRLYHGMQSVLSAGQLNPGQSLAETIGVIHDNSPAFVRDWWQAMYQPQTDAACRFLRHPPSPITPNVHESDTYCLMALEASGVVLPDDVPDLITQVPDPAATMDLHPRATLAAGTRVDSYLVHFDPLLSGSNNPEPIRLVTTIRFPRPIVALVTGTDVLRLTDALVNGRGIGTPGYRRATDYTKIGLDASPEVHADYLDLSDNRMELTLNLAAIEVDQLRVLIEAATDPQP